MEQASFALAMGNTERAMNLAQEVVEEDARHLAALEVLAKAQWRAGRCADVLDTVERLLAINPYEPGYHGLRASAMQSLGKYGEAAKALSRCLDLPDARESLRELEAWQKGLITDLLSLDPVFRASYRKDAEKACADRGFHFVRARQTQSWSAAKVEASWAYARPS